MCNYFEYFQLFNDHWFLSPRKGTPCPLNTPEGTKLAPLLWIITNIYFNFFCSEHIIKSKVIITKDRVLKKERLSLSDWRVLTSPSPKPRSLFFSPHFITFVARNICKPTFRQLRVDSLPRSIIPSSLKAPSPHITLTYFEGFWATDHVHYKFYFIFFKMNFNFYLDITYKWLFIRTCKLFTAHTDHGWMPLRLTLYFKVK